MARYPGVKRLGDGRFQLRAVVVDQRTGLKREVERIVNAPSVHQAHQHRLDLIEQVRRAPKGQPDRVRVGEFAKSWMREIKGKVDRGTADTYAAALEDHVLPALGDHFYDALTPEDVQEWLDDEVARGWTTRSGKRKSYSKDSAKGWLRVLRTMTKSAVRKLRLPFDPTLDVSANGREPKSKESLTPSELVRFLHAMLVHYPQHFVLTTVLAYTGLRFCHASALAWSDWDDEDAILTVIRKQVRGRIGEVSRKKRAPREFAFDELVASVLREHRAVAARANAASEAEGWMFPSSVGTLRSPSSVKRAWAACLKHAGIKKHFVVHGLRKTFNNVLRLAKADPIVRKTLMGHVTDEMQFHYSDVGLAEKREVASAVSALVPPPSRSGLGGKVGGNGRSGVDDPVAGS